MPKRTSTPAKNKLNSLKSTKKSISIQTEPSETSTNTSNYVDEILIQGKHMNDDDFEKFIKGTKKPFEY